MVCEARMWATLIIIGTFLIMSIFFGCRKITLSENFKAGSYSPAPNKISLPPSSNYYEGSPAPAPAPAPATATVTTDDDVPVIETEQETVEEVDEDMNSTEQELFQQITQNKITSEELEKLIKAGVVTDKMIQKFLSRIDSGDTVEPFCSGENTGCSLE